MSPGTPHDLCDLEDLSVVGVTGTAEPLKQFVAESHTRALVVVHAGREVFRWSAEPSAMDTPHPVFSITKSVIGTVAGVLMEQGVLDPEQPAVTYVPELASGGYRGVTVRDLLDMRTGGDYRETHDSAGELARLMCSRDGLVGAPFASAHDMLCRIERMGRHEGPFAYRSLDTEALGWVIERATLTRMDVLAHELVLGPLGCEGAAIGLDAQGCVNHSGGMVMRARDVARFGVMILNSGYAGDHQIVSPHFIKDLRAGNLQDATESDTEGSYRNQFWVPIQGGRELLALGIYGQMLWMDAASDTVFVKLSAWPDPSDPELLASTYAAARACAAALTEGPHRDITLAR